MDTTKSYNNFVKAANPETSYNFFRSTTQLSGKEVQRLYLEEIQETKISQANTSNFTAGDDCKNNTRKKVYQIRDKDIFIAAQSNDVETLKQALIAMPTKVNIVDDYGWSLLMVACQANSVDVVKELLKNGADTSLRDKAGNSARSLVIKNKHMQLVGLFLKNTSQSQTKAKQSCQQTQHEHFFCESCKNTFPNKDEHLSSTLHNINASKHKKIPSCFKIPTTNKGYQIMLRGGWDKDSGLGTDGSGRRYPIKTVQKKDRKGLGHLIKKQETKEQHTVKYLNRKMLDHDNQKERRKEINFRREFY